MKEKKVTVSQKRLFNNFSWPFLDANVGGAGVTQVTGNAVQSPKQGISQVIVIAH